MENKTNLNNQEEEYLIPGPIAEVLEETYGPNFRNYLPKDFKLWIQQMELKKMAEAIEVPQEEGPESQD